MHSNATLLHKLFTSLDNHDHKEMSACYHPDATFSDIAFNLKGRKQIHAMWHMSRIPGLLKEVYVSAKADQPVFLIGAYGGAAAMVIDLIEGKDRAEATWEFQKAAPHAEDLPALYAKFGIEWESYEDIIGFLRAKGVVGLNPLLTEDENRELFRTINLMRMVELVVSGLSRV